MDTAFIDDMGDMTALALQQVEKTIQGKVSDPAVPAEEVSELAKTALEHCTSMLDCLETIASISPSDLVDLSSPLRKNKL